MDNIKESFQRVKKDIFSLTEETKNLRGELTSIKLYLAEICEVIEQLLNKINKIPNPTQIDKTPTPQPSFPTHPSSFEPLKPQNLVLSTGNEGVPTDRQTDRPTDRQSQKTPEFKENSFQNALEILDSLDNIKKEIRLKFKRLTEQELLVFSTLYQLADEAGFTTYRHLAEKLNLTESSVRDYIGRLINKGIPVEKKKINNKQINLTVSQELKRIAPLSTILKLRDL